MHMDTKDTQMDYNDIALKAKPTLSNNTLMTWFGPDRMQAGSRTSFYGYSERKYRDHTGYY